MNENSRNFATETIMKNCGNCIKEDVCQWKEHFFVYVKQIIHEAQVNEHIIEISVKCKYHKSKEQEIYEMFMKRSDNNAE